MPHRRHIPFAFLFGTAAYGKETVLSDIDLGIFFLDLFEDGKTEIEHKIALLFEEPVHIIRLENETIHDYMNINWKNIQYLRSRGLPIVEEYVKKAGTFLLRS